MGGKLPERRELPEELTWDLSLMYADDDAWQKDFAALDPLLAAFTVFRGRLAESPALLRQALEALDALERKLDKVYTFAHLRHDENTADGAARARERAVRAKASDITAACAWFEPEIMAVGDAEMQTLLNAPELAFYKPSLEELRRAKPHTLSEVEERLLGTLSDLLTAPDDIYETLTDADMRFGKVADEHGERVELSHGNYIGFLESTDRKVRRRAFRAMFAGYRSIINTCSATLDGTVQRHVRKARLRHYPGALQAALFADELPEELYTNLIAAVHEAIPALTDYLRLRARCLKLKNPDMYDLFTPICPAPVAHYTFAEARDLVLDALQVMGEEYVRTAQRAFTERWIDVPECRGKRSGAYSGGCYDSAPYLLLNFHGTLNDVFTLAHELGHSMHSFFSHKHQEYHYANYSIFVAEVASITNEMLLLKHLLRQSHDPVLRASLLAHQANEIRTTIFRQTMFAEFELDIHRAAEQGKVLTADFLNEHYYRLNQFYYGGAIQADRLIQYEWARIPHFYYNFYVFKYATGMAAALKFARNILSGDAELKRRYFGFLCAGDSKPVLEIMRDAGVDLARKEAVSDSLREFGEVTAELEALLAAR